MTRGIAPDLTGRKSGRLTVLHRAGSDAHGNALWTCKCDCENEVAVRAPFLKRGQMFCTKQCPYYLQYKHSDIANHVYGRLTALRLVGRGEKRKAIWRFRCECGKEVDRVADLVLQGNIGSCGCLGIESRIKHGLSQTLEYHREAHKRWSARNPAKVIANVNKRRGARKTRTPKWLTDAQWAEMDAFYATAQKIMQETGIVHHVDHIVPLRGKTVSGLHVPWNLQVIPASDNLTKSAKFL